jgi:hypothetical protein
VCVAVALLAIGMVVERFATGSKLPPDPLCIAIGLIRHVCVNASGCAKICDQRRGRCVDESREVSVTAGSQEKRRRKQEGDRAHTLS